MMNDFLSFPLVSPSHHTTRRLFEVFGTLFCFLAAILQCVPYPDWSSRLAAFLLLSLPVGSFGLYFLHAARLLRQSRVVISEAGVQLNIPNFKGGWLFQSMAVQLRWDEICCMQCERYPLIAGGKPIDHYWLHSARGTFLLTEALCREVNEVAHLIAARKGCESLDVLIAPASQPFTSEQEETQLKRNALAVVLILGALTLGIILAVTVETVVGQMLLAGLHWIGTLANLLSIVVTLLSLGALWWQAHRERRRLKQQA